MYLFTRDRYLVDGQLAESFEFLVEVGSLFVLLLCWLVGWLVGWCGLVRVGFGSVRLKLFVFFASFCRVRLVYVFTSLSSRDAEVLNPKPYHS